MLHISDITKMERCLRAFQLSRIEKIQSNPFINLNVDMTKCLMEYFMLKEEEVFIGVRNDDPQRVVKAFDDYQYFINARFAYDELRIKIPFMIKDENELIVYFTSLQLYPKEGQAQYIADTLEVLRLCGYHVRDVYLFHLNGDYVREKELDVRQAFVVSEAFYNHNNHVSHLIKDVIEEKTRDITMYMNELKRLCEQPLLKPHRTSKCTHGRKCDYYDLCFPAEENEDTIMHLVQSAHKHEMHEEGIKHLRDVDFDRIEGTRIQYAQIMADINGGLYFDHAALRVWLSEIVTKPLCYLDFEWETYALPPYERMKPYDVLTFQYSLHVEKNGELQHYGFIGEGDCRQDFILSLIENIPEEGNILVFNMEGAEKLRLMQLAEQFPQFETQLRQIWERMVDLSIPFNTGNVYDIRMKGLYSLKTLVPIFSDYSYEDLKVTNGIDAIFRWREYCQAEGELKQQIYQELTDYCALDTYGEYIVLHALMKEAQREEV